MSQTGFWENVDKAAKVNQEARGIEQRIAQYSGLFKRAQDAQVLIAMAEEEDDESLFGEVKTEIESCETGLKELQLAMMLKGPYDTLPAILSLHAGAGGTEAQDWVAMLYRMYTRYCEGRGYAARVLDTLIGEEAGIKSVTFEVTGENAYGYLKAEAGVHRLVRISPFDSSGRRHTSFASLDVTPVLADDENIPINMEECRVDTYRSSGAGGQHVNKTESAIRITHLPSGIVVACQNERSQLQNRETALRMLRGKLAELKEREAREKMADLKGDMKKIEWGSQIRSYVFQPYTLVKDHRTGVEMGNIDAVMDGELTPFISAYLIQS